MRSFANIVTFFRMCLIPVCLYLISEDFYFSAALLVAVFAVLDGVDGYIARRYHQITKLGIFFDPLADKLFIILTVIYFTIKGFLPLWFVLAVFYRDFSLLMGFLSLILFKKEGIVPPIFIGKISTGLHFSLIFFLCLVRVYSSLQGLTQMLLWMAAIVIVISFFSLSRRWFYLFEGKDI